MFKKIFLVFLILYLLLSNPVFSVGNKWKIKDRWALKQTGKDTSYNKFFAIGIWGVPGYDIDKMKFGNSKEINDSRRYFKKATKDFNLIYSRSQDVNYLMIDKVKMIGTSEFPWIFGSYLNKEAKGIDFYVSNNDIYTGMQKIKNDIQQSNELFLLVKNQINEILKYPYLDARIWAPIDEPASGLGWCWYPNVLSEIYKLIKANDPNSLVYLDLLGNGRGNQYIYQQKYNDSFNDLKSNSKFDKKNYDSKIRSFVKAEMNKAANNSSLLTGEWYDNVKKTTIGYKDCGDIFGINSYSDFLENPTLVGITVDAIFDSTNKDNPVWLFFDSNCYAKPKKMKLDDYLRNIKLQIYLSIIHGATGVLFWNDLRNENTDNFNVFLTIISQLKKNEYIIKLKTVNKKTKEDIQYIEKIDENNKRHILAVNTNKIKSCSVDHPLIKKKTLSPLEVYIN